jgi:hypothetical protein
MNTDRRSLISRIGNSAKVTVGVSLFIGLASARVAAAVVQGAVTDTKNWAKKDMVPAVKKAAVVTCDHVDAGCMMFNHAAVDFLVKYPGIAMSLSPQTVIRMAVAQHVKNLTADKGDASSAENVTSNISN